MRFRNNNICIILDVMTVDYYLSPSYNNSRCVYIYIFPVPRIVATALNI